MHGDVRYILAPVIVGSLEILVNDFEYLSRQVFIFSLRLPSKSLAD